METVGVKDLQGFRRPDSVEISLVRERLGGVFKKNISGSIFALVFLSGMGYYAIFKNKFDSVAPVVYSVLAVLLVLILLNAIRSNMKLLRGDWQIIDCKVVDIHKGKDSNFIYVETGYGQRCSKSFTSKYRSEYHVDDAVFLVKIGKSSYYLVGA